MGFNDFDEVKSRINLVEWIARLTSQPPKKLGKVYGLPECPYSDCTSKKGFRIWPEIKGYKCYACGRSGDPFTFTIEYGGAGNRFEALKQCADFIGYTLQENGALEKKSDEVKIREEIFTAAADFYHDQLLRDAKAMQILTSTRKYTERTIREFKIGYTGNRRNLLLAHLRKKYSVDQLLASGLVKMREDKRSGEERPSDFFVAQLFVFPHFIGRQACDFTIKDSKKHVKKPGEELNYRLPAEFRLHNILFYNQDALYGDEVIITEGEHDAIQTMRASQKRDTIAICGQFSKAQLDHLERVLAGKDLVYLAFDRDSSGEKYADMIFERLWGKVKIRVFHQLSKEMNDIDEFLRKSTDPTQCLHDLKNGAMELFKYMINFRVREYEGLDRQLDELDPYTSKLGEIEDVKRIEVCIEAIRERFDNQSVARIIEKEIGEKKYSRQSSGANQNHLPCYERDGIYLRKNNKGDYGITNFVLRINDVVLLDDEIHYRCTLINDKGENTEDVVFDPSDRTNSRKFRERVAGRGSYYFTGTDSDLAAIWQYEESRGDLKRSYYVQHYGYVPKERMWLWENAAIKDGKIYQEEEGFITIGSRNFKSHDVIVYSGSVPRINLDFEYSREFAQRVADSFHTILDTKPDGTNGSFKGYLFTGFLPAIIYSEEIYAKFGFFPFLFSYGPSATGKTSVTQLLLACFGFGCPPESWDSVTKDGTHKFLQHLGSFPCWYDEFLNDDTFRNMLATLKNIYNRTGSGKGGLRRRQAQEVNGCLWLSGEDNPANEALLSRSVIFRFNPLADRRRYTDPAYKWLLSNQQRLSAIIRQLILDKTDEKARAYVARIEDISSRILERADKMDNRVAINHAIPAAGLPLLGVQTAAGFLEYVQQHAESGYYHKLTESPEYQFFSELSFIYNRGPALNQSVKWEPEMGGLSVHFESAIKVIQKELRFRNERLKIKPSSVKDYLRDLPACAAQGEQVYFPKIGKRRCMVFNFDQLPENIRDNVEFRDEQHPDDE